MFFVWGFTCGPHGTNQAGTDQQQTTDWGRAERAGVTDGLRLPASPLISSEEKPETHGLKGCRADEQVGRQTDRRTNAPIGRHPESRQTHRQMYRQRLQTGSVSVQGLELMETPCSKDTDGLGADTLTTPSDTDTHTHLCEKHLK